LFSENPINKVTDFFDDDLSIDVPIEKESKPSVLVGDANPFSTDQPKMSSYQLFKMMRKKQETNEAILEE